MIRRLHIQGWRAFEDLTLELDDGLTFIVAENGVGKTSLLQAAAWGVYGELSEVDARAARRVGSATTRVKIDLELPDGRTLNITRQVERKSELMYARIGDLDLDDENLARVMAEAFGASREFLSKTTIIPGGDVTDDITGAFQLHAHLCRVFGVEDLQTAADELQRLHNEADTEAKKLRQATRRAATDLAGLRAALTKAETAQVDAETARADSRAGLELAESRLREAREKEAARARAMAAKQALTELLTLSRQVLGYGVPLDEVAEPTALIACLEAAETAAADALDEHRREAAVVAGRLTAVRAATSELRAAGAECPVCRRELSADDVTRAEQTHDSEMTALSTRERELVTLVESAWKRTNVLRDLTRRAARLPAIDPVPEDSTVDVDAAASALDHAREEGERLIEQLAEARARRAALDTQIANEERAARDIQEAYLAHRREAVTSVAAEVVPATADAILTQRIDPLTTEISHRWKRVFGERGLLRLRPDGHLVLVRGIHEIPFAQFSSGEKVVALLAARLLVLGASTKASFLWLDEPLEHLDPKNRRVTASLMTAAGNHVRQILVTTYEEALARRLASAAHAHLRYVRTPDS